MLMIRSFVRRVAVAAVMMGCVWCAAEAQSVKGGMATGAKVGYVSENSSASLSAFYHISFSQRFRLSTEIGGIIRNHNKEAFTLDLNAHIPFTFTGDNVVFYPLAGLNFSSWGKHFRSPEYGSSSKHYNRLGLNFGAGFELRCSSRIKMLFEAKYCLIKSFSSAQIAAGISYTLY